MHVRVTLLVQKFPSKNGGVTCVENSAFSFMKSHISVTETFVSALM